MPVTATVGCAAEAETRVRTGKIESQADQASLHAMHKSSQSVWSCSYVWTRNRWVAYPFQNNISALPQDDQVCCSSISMAFLHASLSLDFLLKARKSPIFAKSSLEYPYELPDVGFKTASS